MLRGAIIGCGHMGRYHTGKLLAREDVDLVGIVDPDTPHHPELPRLDYESLPGDLDFAVVAAPTRLHRALAEPLLARGIACLVEKPLGATLEEARALAAYDRVCVNHVERFNPALAALPAGLEPRYLRLERMGVPVGRGTDVDVIHDLMIHDLDLVAHLTRSEVVELRAVGVPVLGSGVDIAECWLETASGCVATLTASRVSRTPSRRLRVVAADTYWSVDLARREAQRVRWGAGELGAEPVEVPHADALERLIDGFLAGVRGDAPFPVSGSEGLAALELARQVAEQIQGRLDAAR